MRICSIVTSLTSGGAETLVANLSTEYSAAGHDSLVVALCDAATLGNAPDAEARLRRQIEESGGRVLSLGLPARRPLISGALKLRRLLRAERPDILHCHTARASLMLLTGRVSTPTVLTHHNSVLGFFPALFRLLDIGTSGYVAISRNVQHTLEKHCRGPVTYIANAAGRGFTAAQGRSAPASPMRILSVGAISRQKNYPLLIETVCALRDGGMIDPLPIVEIAGNGPDIEHLRDKVGDAGLQENVRFLGERNDVAELMRRSDIYLNTSLYEGMPIALLEAMRLALPIVATDVAGNCELIADGANGFLTSSTPQALAGAIAAIARDRSLYQSLSRGALTRADEFSISTAASRHLDLYRQLAHRDERQGIFRQPKVVS
jgi:glycosyltransferase involved in cell wall biosynthesis